tara:strand:- start:67 stop:558 length:492 start_codon:yes stop_codon:yes gene_type:complete
MFNFNLLPCPADNEYRGNKIALWFFIAFVCLMTWRSIIHMFFEQYGMHSIANFSVLSGDPDPMPLIYMFFSLWGFAQLIFCGVCWIVIFRYKSFIPLMYVFWLVEWSVRAFLYPLTEKSVAVDGAYSSSITPGAVGAPFVTILLVAFLTLSLREKVKGKYDVI